MVLSVGNQDVRDPESSLLSRPKETREVKAAKFGKVPLMLFELKCSKVKRTNCDIVVGIVPRMPHSRIDLLTQWGNQKGLPRPGTYSAVKSTKVPMSMGIVPVNCNPVKFLLSATQRRKCVGEKTKKKTKTHSRSTVPPEHWMTLPPPSHVSLLLSNT